MPIEIQANVSVPVDKVWDYYTNPEHIVYWNFASDDWECTRAKSNLVPGGRFIYHMAAKDKSMGFDFEGAFTVIEANKHLAYKLDDDRNVQVLFCPQNNSKTTVKITFDPDSAHDDEFQRLGWQSILNNFKKYAEAKICD